MGPMPCPWPAPHPLTAASTPALSAGAARPLGERNFGKEESGKECHGSANEEARLSTAFSSQLGSPPAAIRTGR